MVRLQQPSLTLGVEEEYLLVDMETRDLVPDPPAELMQQCTDALGDQVSNEFLLSQIEVGTHICADVHEARKDLIRLRTTVAGVAKKFGIAPIAASTHPFASWAAQRHTPKQRYDDLLRDLAGAARRMVICGMHVHAGIEDDETRVDLMNQISYFLPHLLALSTSSPFWQGEDMGMLSYRTLIFDTLPRTGLPARFDSYTEYQRLIHQLTDAGIIEDATKIWWDVRISARFQTLEMRTPDVCARLEDAITIAALYQSILHMLYRLRQNNQGWRLYPLPLIDENRWRALRYGTDGELVDFGRAEAIPFADLIDELIDMVAVDADELGCMAEVEHAREIVRRGTSAHRQLHIHNAAVGDGADPDEAFRAVVDHLIAETLEGLESPAAN